MSKDIEVFAVTGNPVLHSLSPYIFNAAFKAEKRNAMYTRIIAEKAEEVVRLIKQIGIKGLNVTSPFKEEIVNFLDIVEGDCKKIGAVNTVLNIGGILKGFNTDTFGIKETLKNNGITLKNKKAFVIGAGGAAKAACYALKSEGAHVTIINRTYKKALDIAENLGLKAIPVEEIKKRKFEGDLYINCLPRKVHVFFPNLLKEHAFVLDGNYGNNTIIDEAKTLSYRAIDGKDWLLYQAIKSYEIFTGEFPKIEIIKHALKKEGITGQKVKNISLIGFMGVGKSTIGAYLSELIGFELIETDLLIEKRTCLSIKEIFNRKGERFFREMEKEEIEKIKGVSKKIISLGGGAVLNEKNRDIIKENSIVVWLWTSIETIYQRISKDDTRPLLSSIKDPQSLKTILDERIPLYAQTADLIINVEGKKPQHLARIIYEEVHLFISH